LTFALVLVFSGWQLLGWKRLLAVLAFGAVALAVLPATSPNVRDRVTRTAHALAADQEGVDMALSGRTRIWGRAPYMSSEHPVNGVGAGGLREAFADCDAAAGVAPAGVEGPASHAPQIVLEILSQTGVPGLLFWLAGTALAVRAWNYSSDA